jgi:hypothetical protein
MPRDPFDVHITDLDAFGDIAITHGYGWAHCKRDSTRVHIHGLIVDLTHQINRHPHMSGPYAQHF